MSSEAQIFEMLDKIFKAVTVRELCKPENKDLNTALAAAQAEFDIAKRGRENSEFNDRYADITDVITASRPYLAKNGLGVTFKISNSPDQGILLTCVLGHSSGQYIESSVRILPAKSGPRSLVSELNLMKRVLYESLVGVCAEDSDDDGVYADEEFAEADKKRALLSSKADSREDRIVISREQLQLLEDELDGYSDIGEKLLQALNIRDLCSMPKSKFLESMKKLRAIKEARIKSQR